MKKKLLESAHVQYDDYTGEVAVDMTDMHGLTEYLGLDSFRDIVIRADITSYGGHQTVTAYVAKTEEGSMDELIRKATNGQPIEVREFEVIDWSPEGHSDTNPPRIRNFPAKSVTELLEHAFKRLQITLIPNSDKFPEDTILEIFEG